MPPTHTDIPKNPDTDDPILLRDDREGVSTLTLNRPKARNALSIALLNALKDTLSDLAADDSVRAVILAGNGPVFCAGHDLKEMRANPGRENFESLFNLCADVMLAMTRLPKPVIGRIHATATAAGCQLTATCDLVVASTEARFATPGVQIGLFCSTPMVALSRAVNRKHAMEMLLTGDFVDAQRAHEIGLVNRVVEPGDLIAETDALANQIASRSTAAISIGKEAFYRQVDLDLDAAYAYASEAMTRNMLTHDAEEGIDAFIEKRPPQWEDR